MKIKSLIALLALTIATASQATVTLTATSFQNGLTTSGGSALNSNSLIRYGVFTNGFNFAANASNSAAMEAAFTEVTSQVGVSASGFDGFFQYTLSINEASSFEGVNYGTGIAGKNIFAWVFNNSTPGSSTQQGVFSTGELWGDNLNPNFTFTLQSNAPGGVTTHIGGNQTGPELFTGLGNSYQLASIGAIPEPSRALLGLVGLGALFFRRRR